jgi:hypothetical protein
MNVPSLVGIGNAYLLRSSHHEGMAATRDRPPGSPARESDVSAHAWTPGQALRGGFLGKRETMAPDARYRFAITDLE